VEALAQCDLRGNAGDGVARRLRRERGGAGDARVHLDDTVLAAGCPVVVPRELDVTATLNAEFPDDLQRGVAHLLVAVVGDHLRRRDDHRLARVDTHRVEVLHVADDDGRIVGVAHHLVLQFDPARDGLGDEDFAVPREAETLTDALEEFVHLVDDARPRPAERVGRASDDGQTTDFVDRGLDAVTERVFVDTAHFLAFVERDGDGAGDRLPDLLHALAEEVAVLGRVDGVERRPHDIHVVCFQDAFLGEFGGDVQAGLAAEAGDHAVRLFLPDDLCDGLGRDGFDVHPVGHLGVGHDRRGVRVDEDDSRTLLLQGSAGLRAGVVELGGLADLNRAASDQQYRPIFGVSGGVCVHHGGLVGHRRIGVRTS